MKKKVLAVVLPDGITLRNFVFTGFLEKALDKFEVIVFHYVDFTVFDALDKTTLERIKFYKINTFKEDVLSKAYRYAKLKASLHINNARDPNVTFLRNYPNYSDLPVISQLPFLLANQLAKPYTQENVQLCEKKQIRHFDRGNKSLINYFTKILKENEVSVILNSHQRDVKSLPIVRAAAQLNIPTANFVYSWDNLPKGRMAVPTDHYFLWSDYMKSEMNRYYPDIDNTRITVTGTPQFSFYHTIEPDSRHDFAKRYNLDVNKRWILYSGDMTDASPYDQYYLEDVYEAWQQSPVKNEFELLFRRAPTDLSGRFTEILERCTEIIEIPTLWQLTGEHQMSLMVSKEDVKLLVNIVSHCETAVNFGSTMAHDFAQKGKHVYYLNYNHPAINKEKWSSEIFYAYTHFESLKGLYAVNWINSTSELVNLFTATENMAKDCILWHERITAPTTQAVDGILNALMGLTASASSYHEKE